MNRIRTYISEAFDELFHKVTWPTWSELQSSAVVVMIASIIIAALVFVMDFAFAGIMNLFYSMFS